MKPVLIIFCLLITIGATAQVRIQPALGPDREQQILLEHWKALRITPEQRQRLLLLLRRRAIQEFNDRRELNQILTDEQKKQLNAWKRQSPPKDSTSNNR